MLTQTNSRFLTFNDYQMFHDLKNVNTNFDMYETIKNNMYEKSISELIHHNIIKQYEINESFADFKNKLKDAVGDINQKIVAKIDSVITNIKVFVENAADFLGEMFDSMWNLAKKNMDVYLKNIVGAFQNTAELAKKGFNEEVHWAKEIMEWFSSHFKDTFMNLFKKSVADGVNESIEYYDSMSRLFENDEKELENDTEVSGMFSKIMSNMKKSKAFKMLENFFDILLKISKTIEKEIEKNANKVLTFIGGVLQKFKGLPKSPDEFPNSSKIFTMCVLLIAKQEGLDKGVLEPKKLSIILIKKFVKMFLRGVVPGVDILLLSLKIKSYFILFGTAMKTLSKA